MAGKVTIDEWEEGRTAFMEKAHKLCRDRLPANSFFVIAAMVQDGRDVVPSVRAEADAHALAVLLWSQIGLVIREVEKTDGGLRAPVLEILRRTEAEMGALFTQLKQ